MQHVCLITTYTGDWFLTSILYTPYVYSSYTCKHCCYGFNQAYRMPGKKVFSSRAEKDMTISLFQPFSFCLHVCSSQAFVSTFKYLSRITRRHVNRWWWGPISLVSLLTESKTHWTVWDKFELLRGLEGVIQGIWNVLISFCISKTEVIELFMLEGATGGDLVQPSA